MRGRWLLWGVTTAALSALVAQPRTAFSVRITERTTLGEVLSALAKRTTARLEMDAATRAFVQRYTFPPHMVGVTVQGATAGEVLAFLFGAGWERTPLPRALRAQFPNRQFVRTPMPVVIGGKKLWTCNNRAFDWKWEKPKGAPAGGIIRVWLRVQPDGDLVKREPIDLRPLQDDYALDYLRDRIKDLTGVYFNIDPEWHQNVNYKLLPEYRGMVLPANPEIPLTVRKMRSLFGAALDRPHTLGEWLSIFAAGLNEHAKNRGCVWKWTCSGGDRPVYTLRCYVHTETAP